jgi:glutaredoxin
VPPVTLYTKPDCSLCDSAAQALARVRERVPFDLEVVDIEPDAGLRARYGERVPVVMLDGEPAFEYVVDEQELERMLVSAGVAT